MNLCDQLSERMPAVASFRARWSDEEARHLASCEACRLAWGIVVGTAQLGRSRPHFDEVTLVDAVLYDLQAEVPPLDKARSGHRMWRRRSWMSIAAVLLLALGGITWRVAARRHVAAPGESSQMIELMAQLGRRSTFLLPDGTWVVLRADSHLRYIPPLSTGKHRDVFLEGEAYFAVAPDSARPFYVHAGQAVTRVLGTHFGVRAYPDEAIVRVVVAEGKVSLGRDRSDRAGAVMLGSGELGALGRSDGGDSVVVRHRVDAARYLAWAADAVFTDAQAGVVVLDPFIMDTLTQEHRMHLWTRSTASLMLALPTPALLAGAAFAHPLPAAAQAITPANFVGTWVSSPNLGGQSENLYFYEAIWTFRTDSTWERLTRRTHGVGSMLQERGGDTLTGHWRIEGDTLRILYRGGAISNWTAIRNGEQLLMNEGKCLFKRVDASKPLPPLTPLPSTIKSTDLIGRWMRIRFRYDSSARRELTDTLTLALQADSTLTETHAYDVANATVRHNFNTRTGKWALYPGDWIAIDWLPNGFSMGKVTLQNGQLLLGGGGCDAESDVYKRVTP